MTNNLHLKRGLIIQSLSPVFFLLIIRHLHLDYWHLVCRFLSCIAISPGETIMKAFMHPRFGELLVVICGFILCFDSVISIPAFKGVQEAGFESHGEMVNVIGEQKDAAASFLMTFILPLLIDELGSPQYWVSYVFLIAVVCAVLCQSNLYYQSPVLAIFGYRVFKFKVLNPADRLEENREYIGITKKNMITEEAAIIWKHISDDVFLVYNEGNRRG